MQIMERVRQIESLTDLNDVWAEFALVAKELGFQYLIYTISNNDSDDFYYYDNFGLHTDEQDFYDPFLDYCCHSYEPMLTGPEFLDDHSSLDMPAKAYALIQRGTALGMISGIGIPTRLKGSNRYGGFNLGTGLKRSEFEGLYEQVKESAQLVCMLLHRHIETLLDQQNILVEQPSHPLEETDTLSPELQKLTPRERDILVKIANGQSRKGCAEALFLSESTISSHIKSIYRKLGVHNRVEAAKIALQAT